MNLRLLGEVEKNSLIDLTGKGGYRRLIPSKLCVPGTSLVVSDLDSLLPLQGTQAQSLVRELGTYRLQLRVHV